MVGALSDGWHLPEVAGTHGPSKHGCCWQRTRQPEFGQASSWLLGKRRFRFLANLDDVEVILDDFPRSIRWNCSSSLRIFFVKENLFPGVCNRCICLHPPFEKPRNLDAQSCPIPATCPAASTELRVIESLVELRTQNHYCISWLPGKQYIVIIGGSKRSSDLPADMRGQQARKAARGDAGNILMCLLCMKRLCESQLLV